MRPPAGAAAPAAAIPAAAIPPPAAATRSETAPATARAGAPVLALTINGAIGPATAEYVERGLQEAVAAGAQLVVLRMDTPGGLDLAMRRIIKAILASPMPVASYVWPSGARAASAGTYILYASHVAAMAAGTNLGAATPVQLGAPGGAEPRKPGGGARPGKSGGEPESAATPMERKQVNDASAYIRGLAQMRGRNAEWAERAVREAVSLAAAEALKQHVVDYVAADLPDLLRQLNGQQLAAAGGSATLATAGAAVVDYPQDWRIRFLSVITDPSVAMILMMIGIYGLMFEFLSPGMVAPGVIGGICLLLGMFALQMLPVNYAGAALALLGLGLMVAEAFVPSFGIIGIGGVVALVVGAVILVRTDAGGFGVLQPVVAAAAAAGALLVLAAAVLAVRARRRPVVSGREEMIGMRGEVVPSERDTWARVHGELWRVVSGAPLQPGARVRVVGLEGLTLRVDAEG